MTPQFGSNASSMIMTAASTFAATLRVAALLPAFSLATPSDLAAQATGTVYERRDECIEAGKLTAAQCDFAYRNARAEFEQKAPRYASRALCERSHKRCGAQVTSAGGWESFGRGGATYVPRFTGVRVSGEGAASRAYPVVEGTAKIAFSGRQVLSLDDKVAGRRGTVGLVASRGRGHDLQQQNNAPYVRRGDRDDTVRVPMETRRIGSDAPPGLYVDPDGVEWYKPARRH